MFGISSSTEGVLVLWFYLCADIWFHPYLLYIYSSLWIGGYRADERIKKIDVFKLVLW